jgi:hypothetical protein
MAANALHCLDDVSYRSMLECHHITISKSTHDIRHLLLHGRRFRAQLDAVEAKLTLQHAQQ